MLITLPAAIFNLYERSNTMKKNTLKAYTLSLFDEGKICKKCNQWKQLSEFVQCYGRKFSKDYCIECTSDYRKLYRALTYNASRQSYADKARRYRYGVTAEWFANQMEIQGGVCAICLKPETSLSKLGNPLPLSVDHDHATGKVRGLLCAHCNRGIGALNDDPQILIQAIKYLSLWKEAEPD